MLQIIDEKDEFMFVGTRTGDVMQVQTLCSTLNLLRTEFKTEQRQTCKVVRLQ